MKNIGKKKQLKVICMRAASQQTLPNCVDQYPIQTQSMNMPVFHCILWHMSPLRTAQDTTFQSTLMLKVGPGITSKRRPAADIIWLCLSGDAFRGTGPRAPREGLSALQPLMQRTWNASLLPFSGSFLGKRRRCAKFQCKRLLVYAFGLPLILLLGFVCVANNPIRHIANLNTLSTLLPCRTFGRACVGDSADYCCTKTKHLGPL